MVGYAMGPRHLSSPCATGAIDFCRGRWATQAIFFTPASMKTEAPEVAIADHNLAICGMPAARAQGCLVEFDAIHRHGKGEQPACQLCFHSSPPCSVRFKNLGTEPVFRKNMDPQWIQLAD